MRWFEGALSRGCRSCRSCRRSVGACRRSVGGSVGGQLSELCRSLCRTLSALSEHLGQDLRKGATWHYVRQPADSVALRDVWAPTTADSKAQRRRTAGGVPLPLVSARAPARKCSTTTVCTDVFHCKVAVLQRCQQILCQRISLNAAAFCAPFPNILTTRPHFFPRPNTFPMAHFLLSTA